MKTFTHSTFLSKLNQSTSGILHHPNKHKTNFNLTVSVHTLAFSRVGYISTSTVKKLKNRYAKCTCNFATMLLWLLIHCTCFVVFVVRHAHRVLIVHILVLSVHFDSLQDGRLNDGISSSTVEPRTTCIKRPLDSPHQVKEQI